MVKSVGKEPLITRIGYPFLKYFLVGPLLHIVWIKDVQGLDNIPQEGAYFLASNHESYFDFFFLAAALKRKIHFMAAEKFYKNKIWKLINDCMGSIRVDRYAHVNIATYKEIIKAIRRQRIIGIFPEGTRSPDGTLMRGKTGIAHLALKTGLPVIPVGLVGTYEILPKGKKFPRFTKATIKIGKPLYFDKSNGEDLQNITDEIMCRIADLTGEVYPEEQQTNLSLDPVSD